MHPNTEALHTAVFGIPPPERPTSHFSHNALHAATTATVASPTSSSGSLLAWKPTFLAGEKEVSHFPEVIHLNTIETVRGIGGVQVAAFSGSSGGSSAHAAAANQTTLAFWKGNLLLTNYALTFCITDGANAGQHVAGTQIVPSHHDSAAFHPNLDCTNASLVHIPVGSIWRIEYGKYQPPQAKQTKEERALAKERAAEQADADFAADLDDTANGTLDVDLKEIAFQLTLYCRDARTLSFGFLRKATSNASTQAIEERAAQAVDFYHSIKSQAFPKDIRRTFAFTHMQHGGSTGTAVSRRQNPNPSLEDEGEGWHIYDIRREFKRQGVGSLPDSAQSISSVYPRRRCRWRLDASTNAKWAFSPTYPAAFWLPSELSADDLAKVKSFRSKGRFPALVFNYSDLLDYHSLGLNPMTYPDTVILRSAQPNVGWTFGRCSADEKLLELAEVRVIIDARPYANAVANQAKGGGAENPSNYANCKLVFLNIENIHVMRNSLAAMLEVLRNNQSQHYNTGATNPAGEEFWTHLHAAGWLKHMRILLEGASVCANYVKNGLSILVHCSDGWDRTAQLTSLSQILLDPYFRTRRGFGVLIEKEWLSFGHQFQKRCGHGEKDTHHADERSPIFVQFLDAVWQIMQQHPLAFEFNAEFLYAIADHLYSCRYGTFFGDNDRLRSLDFVQGGTVSIWSDIVKAPMYQNPLYQQGGIAQPSNGDSTGVQNHPGMDLRQLAGSDLGRAAYLHIDADPRRIGLFPYWFRVERRKQHHAPDLREAHERSVVPHRPYTSAVSQVVTVARSALAASEARAAEREAIMRASLDALEADVQRMEALLAKQALELADARRGGSAVPPPAPSPGRSRRESMPWREDLLAHTGPPPIPAQYLNLVKSTAPASPIAPNSTAAASPTWSVNSIPQLSSRDSFIANPLISQQQSSHSQRASGPTEATPMVVEEMADEADLLEANALEMRRRTTAIPPPPPTSRSSFAPMPVELPPPPPPAEPVPTLPRHRCLYAFTARDATHASMQRHEVLEVLDKTTYAAWWRIRNAQGEVGLVPSNRIEQIQLAATPTASDTTSSAQVAPASPAGGDSATNARLPFSYTNPSAATSPSVAAGAKKFVAPRPATLPPTFSPPPPPSMPPPPDVGRMRAGESVPPPPADDEWETD